MLGDASFVAASLDVGLNVLRLYLIRQLCREYSCAITRRSTDVFVPANDALYETELIAARNFEVP